jgi:hypothetical protein
MQGRYQFLVYCSNQHSQTNNPYRLRPVLLLFNFVVPDIINGVPSQYTPVWFYFMLTYEPRFTIISLSSKIVFTLIIYFCSLQFVVLNIYLLVAWWF